MRTTLKRGIGRSPSNGSLTRPVLPPPPINPVVIYEQPQPRSRFLVKAARGLMWVVLACLIVAAGVVGGAYLWGEQQLAGTALKGKHAEKTQVQLAAVPHPDEPAVGLIVGVDQRAGIEHEDVTRSDTLMLVRADPGQSSETSSVSMLSFPRDLRVPIYCPGQAPFEAKINAAFATCNIEGAVATVKALTGLDINYVVQVDFRAFKQVVGQLGGVWVDVDRRYYVPEDAGFAAIDIQPGYQKLSGDKALQYVRFRHYDSDIYRVARQQVFMTALKQRFGDLVDSGFGSLTDFPRLVTAVTKNVKIVQADGEAPSPDTVKEWASLMHDLPSGHLFKFQLKTFTEVGGSDLGFSDSELQGEVQKFIDPDIEAAARAAEAAGIKKRTKQSTPRSEDTSVLVLNGSGVGGIASSTASQLGAYGYEMTTPANGQAANAPRQNYFRTQVYWNPAGSKPAQAAALKVGELFLDADMTEMPQRLKTIAGSAMVVVVVGKTFDGQLPPAPPREEAPVKQAPNVSIHPEYTRDLLRSVRRQVPFQLMIPTRVDSGSATAQGSPVRAYRVTKGHKAVRLTFSVLNDAGGYWGIQQTDWLDAPVLKGSHITRKLQGKTYDFYYDGSHLKMVVYRTPTTSYWVVNTLRNTLSNETMLAIAKGLRPLSA